MAKMFGAILRFLFALVLIAVLSYNTYEISELRAEVNALKAGRAADVKDAKEDQHHASAPGAMEQMSEAQSHTEKASQYLSEKRFADAAREMRAATDAAQRASGDAQAESRGAISDMQRSIAKVSDQTSALWKQAESAASSASAALPKPKTATTPDGDTPHDSGSANP